MNEWRLSNFKLNNKIFKYCLKKCFTWIIFDVVYLADGAF